MNDSVKEAATLKGHQVAFTGKLATMPRAQAIRLVRDLGGIWSPTVGRQTTMLVIGQDGWPLQSDGRLFRKLQCAKLLQSSQRIAILSESSFLDSIGIDPASGHVRLVSIATLSQLLKVPGHRIRRWIELELIKPCETVEGVPQFDFRQVSWAKTVCDCLRAGVPIAKLNNSVKQLRKWLPGTDDSLTRLSLLEKDGSLMVRIQEELVEPSGQRTLNFGDDNSSPYTMQLASGPQTAEQWFSEGYERESAKEYVEAESAYRKALALGGPKAEISFNLANVLYAQGKKVRAVERYWQVVELDPCDADAWNNLGRVLEELCEREEALAAYRQSLKVNPYGLDALYNIADLFDQLGHSAEAKVHLQSYLRHEQIGQYADYARRRLAEAR